MSSFSFSYHTWGAEKQASTERQECSDIMRQIYDENPTYWPYGLSVDQLDGGAYIVRTPNHKAAGFVGWQERHVGMKKVGYYAVGLLKEFRGNGLAKAAVQKLIAEKIAGVDEVRALIAESNMPSRHLAAALDVSVDLMKTAAARRILQVGIPTASAGANAALWDSTFYSDDGVPFRGIADGKDLTRIPMALVNAAGGAYAALPGLSSKERLFTFGLSPFKDLAVVGTRTAKDMGARARAGSGSEKITAGLAGLAAATGLGAYGIYRAIKNRPNPEVAAPTGRIRVRLPRPDGNETELELPLTQVTNLPEPILRGLERDTRRRLREGVRQRAWRKRDGKLLRPYEGGDLDGDGYADEEKSAFFVAQRDSGRTDKVVEGFRNRVNEQRERLQNNTLERKQRSYEAAAQKRQQEGRLAEIAAKRPAPKPDAPAAPDNSFRTLKAFVGNMSKKIR